MIRREGGLESSPLEDVMLERGLISQDDWLRIKAAEERRVAERAIAAEFIGSPRWYERLRMYGYGQFRYNRLGMPNSQLESWQDSSIGADQGFFFRRIRLVLTGQVSDHVAVFIQPDMATNVDGNTHTLSMRDAYGDFYFDRDKEYRVRVGLQRVPCSFDNYQPSRVRMAIDRADATNSCAQSERDMGIAFMWTPKIAQYRFKQMLDYLYGKGDYGVFNITVYNGQGLNKSEQNDNKHFGAHLAYPFELPGGRLFEIGANFSTGKFHVDNGPPGNSSVFLGPCCPAGGEPYTTMFSLNPDRTTLGLDWRDERANFYIYYPPQPWGFLAELEMGRGPKRGQDGIIRDRALHGGYVQGHYQWKYSDTGIANFYARWQEYIGGLKFEPGAPDGRMKETELGIAWQPDPQWEITLAYAFTERMNFSQTTGTQALSGGAATPGSCSSVTFPSGQANSQCFPGQQFRAYDNLIRLQVIWFWN
jgi:hypothetical protein